MHLCAKAFLKGIIAYDLQVEFAPDVCSRVTFVNFTVTRSSLEMQCLNQALRSERPDVDEKRNDLLKLQGEFAVRLRQLEKVSSFSICYHFISDRLFKFYMN